MPLVPNFTIGSVNTGATIDPTAILLSDTSTGSDGAITARTISLYTLQNNLLVTVIPWPLAASTITINPLAQDVALNVVVNWNNSGGTSLYNLGQIAPFTGYGEQYYYNLIMTETSSPGILQDVNYQNYVANLRGYLDKALFAISIGQNLGNSQAMILREIYLVKNSNFYY